MAYYSYMSADLHKVHWIYGFEIDFDTILHIDRERLFFPDPLGDYGMYAPESADSVTTRVTDFLRQEFGCIAPMMGWDPDSPGRERTYVLVVHAHGTPRKAQEMVDVMYRIARLKAELLPDVTARPKWYFSCGAGVFKVHVDWESRPRQFIKFKFKEKEMNDPKRVSLDAPCMDIASRETSPRKRTSRDTIQKGRKSRENNHSHRTSREPSLSPLTQIDREPSPLTPIDQEPCPLTRIISRDPSPLSRDSQEPRPISRDSRESSPSNRRISKDSTSHFNRSSKDTSFYNRTSKDTGFFNRTSKDTSHLNRFSKDTSAFNRTSMDTSFFYRTSRGSSICSYSEA